MSVDIFLSVSFTFFAIGGSTKTRDRGYRAVIRVLLKATNVVWELLLSRRPSKLRPKHFFFALHFLTKIIGRNTTTLSYLDVMKIPTERGAG